jgi:hypothetical protein
MSEDTKANDEGITTHLPTSLYSPTTAWLSGELPLSHSLPLYFSIISSISISFIFTCSISSDCDCYGHSHVM